MMISKTNLDVATLILLGDSILDNASYVRESNGLSVVEQANELFGYGSTLLHAQDGAVINSVPKQTDLVPETATYFVLSVGGNDCLMNLHFIQGGGAKSIADAILQVDVIVRAFEEQYFKLLDYLVDKKKLRKLMICTIYYPWFEDPRLQRLACAVLPLFNDKIIATARNFGLPVIDLRTIFSEQDDYANDIEPSSKGGQKIVDQIRHIIKNHPFHTHCTIYGG